MPVLCDFETRSRADLKKVGGRLYAAHASTEALCCVLFDTDTEEVAAWQPGDPCPVSPDTVLGAHNATGFDRFIAERLGWRCAGWIDTAELARRAGLPGALDALGTRWLSLPKDTVASKYTRGLSKVDAIEDSCPPLESDEPDKKLRTKLRGAQTRAWKKLPADVRRAEVLRRVTAYCASDVEIIATGWPMLRPYLEEGAFGGWEARVSEVDRVVNDRGFAFDADLATRLLDCDRENQHRAFAAAARVVGWTADEVATVVASPAQLAAVIGSPDAKAETIETIILDRSTEDDVRSLCVARQASASIAAGKLRAGLAGVSPDGRLRDTLRYYGAHTGRWSGKRLQPHNFTRPTEAFEKWEDADVCGHADLAGGSAIDVTPDMLDVLLRSTITAGPGNALVVCDFSGVEARFLAWTAGDRKALEVFKSTLDPYKVAAAEYFRVAYADVMKVQRAAGKVSELACGYQGGAAALERMAAKMGIDLDAAGVSAAEVVKKWRDLHAPIVRYWRELGDAFVAAVEGRATTVRPYDFVPSSDGKDVAIFLPSGRPIIYNGVGLARDRWPDGRPRVAPYYLGAKGHREHIYGGKIAENVTQAGCRDLMADALVRAEEAGLCPVLHVHDEIVCEVPAGAAAEALAELHEIMVTLPKWARGFPVGAAGHHGVRYRK